MNTIKHISQEEYNKQRAEFAQNANLKYTDYKIISLGWDCFSRSLPTWYGIKPTKEQGELSYPFDLAMHTLPNIIKVLQNRFADYLEDIEFDKETKLWHNKKYHFKYNHDQTLTTKEEFRERYSKRIENFYNTIRTSQNIFFIYHALASDKVESILLLCSELRKLCENKNFHLIVVSEAKKKIPYSPDISLCHVSRPWKDYSWWQEDHLTLQGVKFEHKIINKIIKIIQENMQVWYISETERRWHRRLVRILSCFIPLQKWRKQFRARYMPKPTTVHQYDMIIPLGENCACATLLKRANLRRYSLPFDWSGLEDSAKDASGGLFTKCRIILQNCDNLLDFDDLEERARKGHDEKHRFVVNKRTGLRYMHDFLVSSSLSDQYPEFLEKYNRRIERLYSEIQKSKRILILYNRVMPKNGYKKANYVEPFAVLGVAQELKRKWPHKKFHFLIFLHDENIDWHEYKEEHPYANMTYVYLNNLCPDIDTHATLEYLGNRSVVCNYLKDHITLPPEDKLHESENSINGEIR